MVDYDCKIAFIAANGYGLSAKNRNSAVAPPLNEGDQLNNYRAHDDLFKIHKLESEGDNIITIESVTSPGLFIGLGPRSGNFGRNNPFKAILVNSSRGHHKLRAVPAINGSDNFVSFEPLSQPDYVLNHCNGIMYFSNRPNWPNTHVYQQDSSWRTERKETLEEVAQRLPPIVIRQSSSTANECPCCFEAWGTNKRMQVVTECGHSFCIQCIHSICRMSPPLNTGHCAMCRKPISLSELKRAVYESNTSGIKKEDG